MDIQLHSYNPYETTRRKRKKNRNPNLNLKKSLNPRKTKKATMMKTQ